ncbi:hypothetical protein [Actinomyces bowdenii]|uniref:Uncharacterized protein n=1 Tax=Actinomyces bowdenii TaxID=131109 RepID=A0A3P1UZ47_9ACTO|nr:hypothetical protein [Actinomyces bowdenii]RRD27289.1 hypothetical protein EII10_09615 [Actinomyces bowdenii]
MRILRNVVLLVAGAVVVAPIPAAGAHTGAAWAGHPAPAVLAAQADAGKHAPRGHANSVFTPVGTPVTVQVEVDDEDTPADQLTVTLLTPVEGVEFDAATRTLHVPATKPIPLTVLRFRVSDGEHTDLFESTVMVYAVPKPTITLTPEAVEVEEGQEAGFELVVDPDGRNDLEVTIPDLPDWLTWDKQTNRISGLAPAPGVFTFTVEADGKTYATGRVTVTAKPAPSPTATAKPSTEPTAGATPSATATAATPAPDATTPPGATAEPTASASATPASTATTAVVPGTPAPASPQGTPGGSLARTGASALLLGGLAVSGLALGMASLMWRRMRRAG